MGFYAGMNLKYQHKHALITGRARPSGRFRQAMGDPGLFSFAKGLVKSIVPGGGLITKAVDVGKSFIAKHPKAAGAAAVISSGIAATGLGAAAASFFGAGPKDIVQAIPGGGVVVHKRRRRRMNPMNARAANRAIRRIVSVRKILHKIESHLPKQHHHTAPVYAFQRKRRKAA